MCATPLRMTRPLARGVFIPAPCFVTHTHLCAPPPPPSLLGVCVRVSVWRGGPCLCLLPWLAGGGLAPLDAWVGCCACLAKLAYHPTPHRVAVASRPPHPLPPSPRGGRCSPGLPPRPGPRPRQQPSHPPRARGSLHGRPAGPGRRRGPACMGRQPGAGVGCGPRAGVAGARGGWGRGAGARPAPGDADTPPPPFPASRSSPAPSGCSAAGAPAPPCWPRRWACGSSARRWRGMAHSSCAVRLACACV